ncbi:UDP-glucosyl transferase 89B1 [Actinidia rufa]|uniref:UDP-glucosyl transferase 89B1 n=1 Tax=Actinidia rufa TaxID=165716 RepID=A0A7J0EH43_9ERIC|nr:UDP-glucosyl transferase 89B1 [Actinidia rufa]
MHREVPRAATRTGEDPRAHTRPGGGCMRSHAPGDASKRPHVRSRAREVAAHARARAGHAPGRLAATRHAPARAFRGQGGQLARHARRPEGHIKRDCPKYKAQDQSSDTAATAVMAVDESEVLLAASDDGKSDWVLDSGSAYHLCRDREVFSTYAACEGRIWMANNTSSRVVGRGSVRFRMADGRSVTLTDWRNSQSFQGKQGDAVGKKTRGLYRLEGNVQTGGATVRRGSSGIGKENGQGKQQLHRGTQSKRRGTWGIRNGTWRIRSGTRAQGDALGYVWKSGQTRVMQPVQDVHREAQRKETKSILRSCTAKGAATPKRVSFALDLISGGHLGEKVQALRCGGAYTSVGSGVAFLMRLSRGISDNSALLEKEKVKFPASDSSTSCRSRHRHWKVRRGESTTRPEDDTWYAEIGTKVLGPVKQEIRYDGHGRRRVRSKPLDDGIGECAQGAHVTRALNIVEVGTPLEE